MPTQHEDVSSYFGKKYFFLFFLFLIKIIDGVKSNRNQGELMWQLQWNGKTVKKQCTQFDQFHQGICFQAFNEHQTRIQLQNSLLKKYRIFTMLVPSSNCNISLFITQWLALAAASNLAIKFNSPLLCTTQDISILCRKHEGHT